MSTEQDSNAVTNSRWISTKSWFINRCDEAKLLSKTIVALVLIVNSMALGLLALDLIKPNQDTANVFGVISIAFAAVILGTFVHRGVKQQSTNKRKR